jgi:hypothetical protein
MDLKKKQNSWSSETDEQVAIDEKDCKNLKPNLRIGKA